MLLVGFHFRLGSTTPVAKLPHANTIREYPMNGGDVVAMASTVSQPETQQSRGIPGDRHVGANNGRFSGAVLVLFLFQRRESSLA